MSQTLTIQYLYNSGFTIDYQDTFLVIDYWKGDLVLPKDKKILFIVTHAHADHYNPAIFSLPGTENALYLLSEDVERMTEQGKILHLSENPAQTRVRKIVYDPSRTRRIAPLEQDCFGGLSIRTFPSTDQGMAILFTLHDVNFFHAGDLNAWKWPASPEVEQKREVRDYLQILRQVSVHPIDVGFGVVDPRLEENAMLGGSYYLKYLHPQIFFPMHFREHPQITEAFRARFSGETGTVIQAIHKPGERFVIQA